MSFWEALDKLRHKSVETRKRIMWLIISTASFVLLVGWFFLARPLEIYSKKSLDKSQSAKEGVSDVLSPLSSLKQEFSQLGSDVGDLISRLGVLSQEPPKASSLLRPEPTPRKLPLTQ